MNQPETERYASVWDAIADTPEEAANLRLRSELMD
jgi:predicted XRE-type DNA-binding protein